MSNIQKAINPFDDPNWEMPETGNPIFELTNYDAGWHIKIYANGMVEGAPPRTAISCVLGSETFNSLDFFRRHSKPIPQEYLDYLSSFSTSDRDAANTNCSEGSLREGTSQFSSDSPVRAISASQSETTTGEK